MAAVLPKLDLREYLVRERVRHDETGVSRGTTQVHEPTLGEQNDAFAVREDNVIHLRFDVLPLVLLQVGNVDFVIEVPDVADDCLILHAFHLRARYDMVIAGRGHDDVGLVADLVEPDNTITFHRGLQGIDRIDFRHPDRCAKSTQRLCTAFANVAVAADNGDFAGDHDIGCAFDTVDE